MTRVLGLDLSLTGTGIAIIDGGAWEVCATTLATKGKRADSLAARHARLAHIRSEIWKARHAVDLAIVEAPAGGVPGGSVLDRHGLWWFAIDTLITTGIPTVTPQPSQVKKFATNKGNASKTEVGVAMARMWPEVDGLDDNGWDALALAHIGAARLSLNVPSRAHHAGVLDRITWPDNLPVVA